MESLLSALRGKKRSIVIDDYPITGVVFTENGVLTNGSTSKDPLRLWNMETGKPSAFDWTSIKPQAVTTLLLLTPTGVVTGHPDGSLLLWDLKTRCVNKVFEQAGKQGCSPFGEAV